MKKIPLEVSSTLTNLTPTASLCATPYANATGVTTEAAPVLLSVRSERTVGAEEFAARMLTAGGQGTLAQARLALNAIAAVLVDLVDEFGAITVNTPFGTVETFIAGTLESPQDRPDPERNYPYLTVIVPETYRRLFEQIEAYVPADACPAALKRVRDKATNAKGIRGTAPFYLEGRGMSIGGEGETLELLDAVTRDVICAVSVDAESKSPVQFLCTLAPQTAIEAGEYLLRLMTLAGGEPGSALWPCELDVELLEAVAPPAPAVDSVDSTLGRNKLAENTPFTVHGLQLGDARKLTLEYVNESGVTTETDWTPVTPSDDGRSIEVERILGLPHGIDASHPASVKLYPEGSTELLAELGGITWVP